MSDRLPSRALLLEQLESRCLLAAGLFSFSERGHGVENRHDDHQRDRSPDRNRNDRPAHVHSSSAIPPARDAHRDHGSRNHVGHQQDRGKPPRTPNIQAPAQPVVNVPSAVRQAPINTPETVMIDLPAVVIRVSDSSTLLSSSEPQTRGQRLSVAQATSSAVDQVLTSSGDSSSRISADAPAAGPTTSSPDRVRTTGAVANSAVAAARVAQVSVANDPSATVPMEQSSHDTNFPFAIDPTGVGDQGGWIDSLPLLRNTPPIDHGAAAEQPWELGGETLRRLRAVAERPIEEANSEPGDPSARPTDAVIALWFQGPGGLVELETAGGTLIAEDSSIGIVDIVLDATFGLHRTLDLAAAGETTSTGEAVRDAILAAIAGEQTATAAPIKESAANRWSAIAYPAAAILATTLAIAKRHRQANAQLATGKVQAD